MAKIESIKILLDDPLRSGKKSEVLLGEKNYELIDKIRDGYKSTIQFKLPEQTKLVENSVVEVSYEYWYDDKKRKKKTVLNTIRLITLFIVLGNFILSYIHLGNVAFWLS